ncbi:hypothetical protein ABFS83_13G064500 [Erythranthe nasuta]
MRTVHSSAMQGFRCGDIVEIASTEEGFVGSYYEAMVLAPQLRSNRGYIVQYRTLIADDLSGLPLKEVAPVAEIRPRPPKIAAAEFRLHDVVDAFDNDGWWVGRITGRNTDGDYFVYFDTTGDEIAYPLNRIRVHRDWVNGKWVLL